MSTNRTVTPCLTWLVLSDAAGGVEGGLASSSHFPAEKAKPRIKCGATEEGESKVIKF